MPARAQGTRRATGQARGYPSNLTDAQWQVLLPYLPADGQGRRGRPRVWPARAIVEAILYVDRTGCAWRYVPADFPPWRTVYGYFAAWRDDGTLARLHDVPRAQVRIAAGRDPEPTAAVITAASVKDRDAARPLLWNLHRTCRRIRLIWADAVYTERLPASHEAMILWAMIALMTRRLRMLAGLRPATGQPSPAGLAARSGFYATWPGKARVTAAVRLETPSLS